jgi:hypothetical protein
MAEFTANLNPASNQTSLTDLLKTSAYLKDARLATLAKNKGTWTAPAKGQDIPFTFGSGQQAPTTPNVDAYDRD